MSLKSILRNRETEENVNRGGITQTKQAHNKEGDDIYSPELEQTLIDKEEISDKIEEKQETGEENEETKKENNKILEMLFHISTIAFWSLYYWIYSCLNLKSMMMVMMYLSLNKI